MPLIPRLKKRPQFLAAAASGHKHVAKGMIVQARRRREDEPGYDPSRGFALGFTASKKVGNAVARNRAKRRLRALAHEALRDLPAAPIDLVLIARKQTLERDYQDLTADFQHALKRLLRLCAAVPPGDDGRSGEPQA